MKNTAKEIKRIKGSNVGRTIADVVDRHDRLKGSYFFRPPSSASARRQEEKRNTVPEFTFRYDGREYAISQTVRCSCKNYYYNLYVSVDGKKKDIRALKQLLT